MTLGQVQKLLSQDVEILRFDKDGTYLILCDRWEVSTSTLDGVSRYFAENGIKAVFVKVREPTGIGSRLPAQGGGWTRR